MVKGSPIDTEYAGHLLTRLMRDALQRRDHPQHLELVRLMLWHREVTQRAATARRRLERHGLKGAQEIDELLSFLEVPDDDAQAPQRRTGTESGL